MNTITVSVAELLSKLKANRETHRATFDKAVVGYRDAAIKALDEMLDDAKAGREIRRSIGLIQPQDHTDDYDTVIAMLEMEQRPDIEISRNEFQSYVLDKWAWAEQFGTSVMGYIK